jgi:chemotaxis protein MotB
METKAGMFFEIGNAKPTDVGVGLMRLMAGELGKLPNRLLIEGHTDATPYTGSGAYTNWELSSDRANQARQLMQANGLKDGQVFQVRGFADQQLRDAKVPTNPSNRRITVIVQYQPQPSKTAATAGKAVPGGAKAKP